MYSLCGRRSPVAERPYPWSGERRREMSSTPAEFRRALVQAFGVAVGDEGNGLLLAIDDVRLHFALQSLPARQIGALQLARLQVDISVQAGTSAAAEQLLARVDRATQRGGG